MVLTKDQLLIILEFLQLKFKQILAWNKVGLVNLLFFLYLVIVVILDGVQTNRLGFRMGAIQGLFLQSLPE